MGDLLTLRVTGEGTTNHYLPIRQMRIRHLGGAGRPALWRGDDRAILYIAFEGYRQIHAYVNS